MQLLANQFTGSFAVDPHLPGHVVWLKDVKAVELAGNVVSNQGPYAGELVGSGTGVDAGEAKKANAEGFGGRQ